MALGAASESAPLVALCGDLSMLHDGNGFLIDPLPPAVFVIVNNNGGGLFYELPQAKLGSSFERLFLTPHGRDFEQLAAFHDVGYARVEEPGQFPKAVLDAQRAGGVQLVEALTDAQVGADLRRRLDAVAAIAWSG
jgi:2-succinyl-5-enolpyruvyl-6-hydroxy-3-cyclohexene-1-carboxylate synthase